MNIKNLLILVLTLIFHFSCSGVPRYMRTTDFSYFRIAFEQGGQYFFLTDNSISLKKEPFSIFVYLNVPDGILVNASFYDDSFNAMTNGVPESEIPGFQRNTLPDEISNSNNMLFISRHSPSYWYYINEHDNVFNSIERISRNIILCERKIDKIHNIDTNQIINIENIDFQQIYLCFLKSDWSTDFRTRIELKREAIIINFE